MFPKNFKPLIIGGSGPVGIALTRTIASIGHVASTITKRNYKDVGGENFAFDLINYKQLDLTDYTHVIYAAQSRNYKSIPIDFHDLLILNVLAPAHVAGLCHENKIPFVYFSTGSVYRKTTELIDEHSKIKENSELDSYSSSKIFGETAVIFTNPNSLILRPFYIFGLGSRDYSLVGSITTKIINGQTIYLSHPNGMMFSPIGASEIADATLHLMSLEQSGTFNLAGDRAITLRHLIIEIGKALGIEPNIETTEEEETNLTVSIEKLKATGYKPKSNYRADLLDFIESLKHFKLS